MTRFGNAALIVAGGTLGTALRAWMELSFGATGATTDQWPQTTFWINVSGSLMLALVLETLAAGEDVGWRRSVRLGVGTGILGGFTTYSAFSLETVELLRNGQWLSGVGYATSSVGCGIAAAVVGMLLVRRVRSWKAAA